MSHVPLDIGANWGRLNDSIIDLVDYIPEDKLEWSPRPDLFNLRGILAHIAFARQNWMTNNVEDGEETPNVLGNIGSQDAIKEQLKLSWERVERFLGNQGALDATYEGGDGPITGHWIAYHLLEHDIHHRSDIFHYLALLEIDHPEIGTP